jgi:hypothetical protein
LAIRVLSKGNSITQRFAMEELVRYLSRMMPDLRWETDSGSPAKTIWVGLFEDFGIPSEGLVDKKYDDAFVVDIDELEGLIAGSNDRSILFGIYRFLEQAGCHWARHGATGEYIPEKDVSSLKVRIEDRAAYRYRGVCIEGADTYENVLDNIDWIMKVGLNSYFLEFFIPYTFFERYYSHKNSTCKKPEPLSVESVKKWTGQLEGEIKKRGLLYHAVGHGWTCKPLGLPGFDWDPVEDHINSEDRELLALVGGKRELYQGVPINTNLCYSNPKVRTRMVKAVVDYLESHRYVDLLHFWLADNFNNHCECPNCQNAIPSDFYVKLLNEIDAELTRLGNTTRIVFLAYEDLLWAPEKEKFINPDRFVFLFAPISRTYSKTYDVPCADTSVAPYNRNHLTLPRDVGENIAHMYHWRKMFHGDAFAYEYYFMWDHLFDPGYYGMTEVMSQDIRNLRKIGLNGLISDQCQRSFFPTGFPMYVMGRMLWDDKASVDDIAREYFDRTFGEDGEACRHYLKELSMLFDLEYMRGEKTGKKRRNDEDVSRAECCEKVVPVDENIPLRLAQIPSTVSAFLPTIRKNVEKSAGNLRNSWEYLLYHAEIVTALSRALLERENGNDDTAKVFWSELADMVSSYEDILQPVLDVFEYIDILHRKFN